MRLVLDASAVSALLESKKASQRRQVRRAMHAAFRLNREVAVASVTLAELYRGVARSSGLDSLLAREEPDGILLRDTDRHFARLVGGVLAEARAGSEHLADAHAVASAVEVGGGVVMTSDPRDLTRLAAPYRTIMVEPLR